MVKNLPAYAGDIRDSSLIPGWGRSPGGGHGNPLQFSCLESPMDRGAWRPTVHKVAKSRTQLKRLSTHTESLWRKSTQVSERSLQFPAGERQGREKHLRKCRSETEQDLSPVSSTHLLSVEKL